jgi:hypothetical protein
MAPSGNSIVSTSFELEEARRSLYLAEQARNSQKNGMKRAIRPNQ